MYRFVRNVVCMGVLTAVSLGLVAGEAKPQVDPPSLDVEAAKKELEALGKRQGELSRQLRTVRARIEKSDAAKELRQAAEQARKKYYDTGNSDPGVVAAKKVEGEASAAERAVVEKKLAENQEAAGLRKTAQESVSKIPDLRFQQELARFKLTNRYSPAQRKLDEDAELEQMRQEAYAKKDRKERGEAIKAYNAKRTAKLATIPEAQALQKEIDAAAAEVKKLEDGRRQAEQRILAIRREIERGKDPDRLPARKKVDEARKATRAAWETEGIKALRTAMNDANKALQAKVTELLKADEKGAALSAQAAEIKTKYDTLRKQLRDATREKPKKK